MLPRIKVMDGKRAWSPAEGPDIAPQQIPGARIGIHGDGSTERAEDGLWAPSEGPVFKDPGGWGGAPDGKTISIPGRTALNER